MPNVQVSEQLCGARRVLVRRVAVRLTRHLDTSEAELLRERKPNLGLRRPMDSNATRHDEDGGLPRLRYLDRVCDPSRQRWRRDAARLDPGAKHDERRRLAGQSSGWARTPARSTCHAAHKTPTP